MGDFIGNVALPDWNRLNQLFNDDALQVRHNQALASNYAPEAASLENQTSQQNLTDRSTLRNIVPGLAARNQNALATAASLPVGIPAVNALSTMDSQTAASQIAIDNCVIQRGVMTQNPYAIQFWEEAGRGNDFDLPPHATITRTVFVNYTPLVGSTFTALVGTAKFMNPQLRVYASVTMDGCSSWGVPNGQVATASGPQGDPAGYLPDGDTHDFTPTVTNHTYLTAPPVLDFTPPTTHNHGRSYYHNAVADLDNPVRWRNFYDAQIDPGVDQIRISKNAPAGTVVFTPTAFGCTQFKVSGASQPDPRINPYKAGDAWAIGSNLGDPYGYQYGFDTAKYVVNPNNGQVTVRNTLDGSVGMDLVPIRNTPADTTNGRLVEWAFAVERV